MHADAFCYLVAAATSPTIATTTGGRTSLLGCVSDLLGNRVVLVCRIGDLFHELVICRGTVGIGHTPPALLDVTSFWDPATRPHALLFIQ